MCRRGFRWGCRGELGFVIEGCRARSDEEQTRVLRSELDDAVSVEDFRAAIDRLRFRADKTEENLRHDILRVSRVFEGWAFENPIKVRRLLDEVLDRRQNDPATRPPFLDGVDPPEEFGAYLESRPNLPRALYDFGRSF